jgi:tetratricopeptide (TPR) repeat protein
VSARAFRTHLSVGLVVAAALFGAPALAGDGKETGAASGEASDHFKNGVAFYKDGDFTAAQVEFKRAYELSPTYRVLYNLGQTSRELKDYASALSAFEQYLREGGKEIPALRRKDVQAWVDQLKKKVGTITVSTNVEGAEILLDDAPIGVTPLAAPVVVNVGRHKFSASRSGYQPVQRAIDVAGMQEASVALDLPKIEEAPPPPPSKPEPSPEPPPPAEKKPRVAPWVMLSVTAASGVLTGVMGGLALSAHGDLHDALATYPGSAATIKAAQDKTRTFAIATDVAGGITLAGAITTAVLFLVAPGSAEKPPPATSLQLSPTGIAVRGSF